MTHEDKGNFRGKHDPDRPVNGEVKDALKNLIKDNGISCAAAHKLAKELGLDPAEIGFTMDHLEVKITACQMGLFGYSPQKKIVEPAPHVHLDLKKAIESKAENNRLPCKSAWDIADTMGIKRMEVASACEALQIKITPCQLGAF